MIQLKHFSVLSLCTAAIMTLTLCPRHLGGWSWHYHAPTAIHGVQNPQVYPVSQYGPDGWYRKNGAWYHDGGLYPDTNYPEKDREYNQHEWPRKW